MRTVVTFLLVFLVGCSSVDSQRRATRLAALRVSTVLHAKEFNPVTSVYTERPTTVFAEDLSDGKKLLAITMEKYAIPPPLEMLKMSQQLKDFMRLVTIRFQKDQVAVYVEAIDKFLAWQTLATERKEAFTKKIGRLPSWAYLGRSELDFTFHSGNQRSHYLSIEFVSAEPPYEDKALYFDQSGVIELKRLLEAFASDTIQTTDVDKLYR